MKHFIKLILILVISSSSADLFACTCGQILLEKEIEETQYIFSGKAIKVAAFYVETNGYEVEYSCTTFEIINFYKGASNDIITVTTEPSSASCGYQFELDSNYLVFGYLDYYREPSIADQITTGLCTRTGFLSQNADIISKLNKIESKINSIESISSSELYGRLWQNELFYKTDKSAKPCLSEVEQLNRLKSKLTYCEPDSIFPKSRTDSIIFRRNSWNFKPTEVTISFQVDLEGNLSNFNPWNLGNTDIRCQKIAIEYIKNMGAWKPATIDEVSVKSNTYYTVDFEKVKSR